MIAKLAIVNAPNLGDLYTRAKKLSLELFFTGMIIQMTIFVSPA